MRPWYWSALRICTLLVVIRCSEGQLTSICVQTVSEIIKNLHQVPTQHGLPTKQTTVPLLIFKRRFRDVGSQERYLRRLVKAYQSERVKSRLRLRRKRDTVNNILAECVKTVCMERSNGSSTSERVNVPQLKTFYRKMIARCIVTGGGEVTRTERQEPELTDKCFDRTEGMVLIGISDQNIKDVSSVQVCERLCATAEKDSDLICKSAIYYTKEKECILASESKDTMAELYVEDSNGVYIHNKCVGKGVTSISTTTLHPTTGATTNSQTPQDSKMVQPSGYESPTKTKEDIVDEMPFEANPDQIFYGIQPPRPKPPAIPDEVVDSYGMDLTSTPKEQTYRQVPVIPGSFNQKRLFDETSITTPKCFTRFRPLHVKSIRSTNTTSLEECTNLCLKCSSCLKGFKCEIVGFSKQYQQCVLAQTDIRWQIKSAAKLTDFVYFKRESC